MPRLKGKQSNPSLSAGLLVALVVIAIAVPLQQFKVMNWIGDRATPTVGDSSNQAPAIANETIDRVDKIDR